MKKFLVLIDVDISGSDYSQTKNLELFLDHNGDESIWNTIKEKLLEQNFVKEQIVKISADKYTSDISDISVIDVRIFQLHENTDCNYPKKDSNDSYGKVLECNDCISDLIGNAMEERRKRIIANAKRQARNQKSASVAKRRKQYEALKKEFEPANNPT